MNTVLRVKRKCHDQPMSSLVIACKRPRMDSLSSESNNLDVKTVAQLVGTVSNISEDFHKVINFDNIECKSYKRMSDDEIKPYLSKKSKWIDVNTTIEKIKINKHENLPKEEEKTEHLCDNLAINTEDASAIKEKWMTFIDMQDTWSNNPNKHEQKDKEETYVYDLYYMEVDEDVWSDSSKIFIQQPNHFETYSDFDNVEDTGESSDSNSESNWRNDYPDTDPFDSDDASDDDSVNESSSKSNDSFEDSDRYDSDSCPGIQSNYNPESCDSEEPSQLEHNWYRENSENRSFENEDSFNEYISSGEEYIRHRFKKGLVFTNCNSSEIENFSSSSDEEENNSR